MTVVGWVYRLTGDRVNPCSYNISVAQRFIDYTFKWFIVDQI